MKSVNFWFQSSLTKHAVYAHRLRSPASRHRVARKQLRLRTSKSVSGLVSKAIHDKLIQYVQKTEPGKDDTLDSDEPE